MTCPTCHGPMLLLFTSAVCDRCNPPKNSSVAEPKEWRHGKLFMLPDDTLVAPCGSPLDHNIGTERSYGTVSLRECREWVVSGEWAKIYLYKADPQGRLLERIYPLPA